MAIETTISNIALGRIGAAILDDYETDTSPEAIQCRLHYDQTRKSLLRSFCWNFAKKRATLSASTTTPDHEWTYAYNLPSDFVSLIRVYQSSALSYEVENNQILTDYDELSIKYIANIEDPAEFDELFTEVFILRLALKILPSLTGAGYVSQALQIKLQNELLVLERKAAAVNNQENNSTGDCTWNNARG